MLLEIIGRLVEAGLFSCEILLQFSLLSILLLTGIPWCVRLQKDYGFFAEYDCALNYDVLYPTILCGKSTVLYRVFSSIAGLMSRRQQYLLPSRYTIEKKYIRKEHWSVPNSTTK